MEFKIGKARTSRKLKLLVLNLPVADDENEEDETEAKLVDQIGDGIQRENVKAVDFEAAHTATEFRDILLQKKCVSEEAFTVAQAENLWRKLLESTDVTVTALENEVRWCHNV